MATIMIVDDELSIRRMLEYMLSQTHHTVLTANDGEAALTKLSAQTVDVLVLDVAMPVMDGLTLLQRLRALPAYQDLPVIVLTAGHNERKRTEALGAGADMYLNKLIRPEEFLAAIDQMLQKNA